MVAPSSTAPPSASFPTRTVPSVSLGAVPSRPSHQPTVSPTTLGVPSGSGVSGGLLPVSAAAAAATAATAVAAAAGGGPRKHDLSQDDGLSPGSSVSPPATGYLHPQYAGQDGSPAAAEDHRCKRRKSGPGSRGVANLTPEQLAKKRANDREAQRAVRERTKNQIEQLENRIRELTSLQPYQELQAVIRAKEAVEAENAEIKSRLASIMALIQPVMSGDHHQGVKGVEGDTVASAAGTATSTATSTAVSTAVSTPAAGPVLNSSILPVHPAAAAPPPPPPPPPPSAPPSLSPVNNMSPDASMASPSCPSSVDTPPYCPGRAPNAAATAQPRLSPKLNQAKSIGQRPQDLLHNLDLGAGEQLQLNFLLDPSQRVNKLQNGLHGVNDPPTTRHPLVLKREWSGTSFPVNPTHSGPATTNDHSHPRQQQQQQSDVNPEPAPAPPPPPPPPPRNDSWMTYSAPIKNSPPTCLLDNLLLAFIDERRQRAAEGIPTQEVVGPRYPSVSSLLNPAATAYVHPMTKVFADILATFPGLSTLPERVAILYCMFLNMRWWINPSPETYELLPDWSRPTPAQLTTPHPAWVDHVPFPAMRNKLAREYNPDEYLFDNFFITFTSTISVNWPYEPGDALLQTTDGSELLINPVFERHLRRLGNWTLGADFDKAFPQLRGTYNLKPDTVPRPVTG